MSAFPLLFALPPSNRHEIVLVDTGASPKPTLKSLNRLITAAMASSPNCAEFMGKYKAKDEEGSSPETIQELRVHWAESGRDRKVWPEYTLVTEENLGAVLELLRLGQGRDVLEVKVGKGQ